LTRSNWSAGWATRCTVILNIVVRERFDNPTVTYKHSVTSVEVDEVLADPDNRSRDSSSASGLNSGSVAANLTPLNTITAKEPPTVLSAKTPAAEFPEKVESVAVAVTPDLACIPFTLPLSPTLSSVTLAGVAAAATAFTPSSRVVSNYTVSYVQLEAIGIGGGDAVTREPKDYAVFDIDGFGLDNVYSLYPVTKSVNGNTANCDHVGTCGIYDDARSQGSKD
jgi:hypothetical protein